MMTCLSNILFLLFLSLCASRVSEAACTAGLFGPSCLYVDLAQGASTKNSLITDNNDSTCVSVTNVSFEWSLPFVLTWIRINSTDMSWQPNVKVTGNLNKISSALLCSQKAYIVNNKSSDVFCNSNVLIDHLFVDFGKSVSICSMYISGGRNVALKKLALQSSTSSKLTPSLAVDGDITKCSSTNSSNPSTWNVTLSESYLINSFVIIRNSSKALNGFRLEVIDVNNVISYNYTDTTSLNNVTSYSVRTTQQLAKSVRISYNTTLMLCEVQIYGDCISNKYGLVCNQTCNCNDTREICYVDTGFCRSGCAPGFQGSACQTPCNKTSYGPNCSLLCPSNCNASGCNRTNGICFGCPAGFKGDTCSEVCETGTWGAGCTMTCVNCANLNCSKLNGNCLSGCISGFNGTTCTIPCPAKRYGPNCVYTCSTNCINSTCNSTTGSCPGCTRGYRGEFCNDTCQDGTWGMNCNLQCSSNCTNSTCNIFNGTCTDGCISGSNGEYCNKACAATKYGPNCFQNCSSNCTKSDCDDVTGFCQSGCKVGYQGNFCDQACDELFYGPGCTSKCNATCLSCSNLNGRCSTCVDGKNGTYCDTDCRSGTYGNNCSKTCSSNCSLSLCNPANGSCVDCILGHKGAFCDQLCDSKTYGYNCNNSCSQYCNGTGACNAFNGTCLYGCVAGYLGSQCVQECKIGKYGVDCNNTCSAYCNQNNTQRWCDHKNGECVFGCHGDSYENRPECRRFLKQTGSGDETSSAAIAVPIVIVIVITACLVGVMFYWRRRKACFWKKSNRHSALDDKSIESRSLDDFDAHNDCSEMGHLKNEAKDNTAIDVTKLYIFMRKHSRDYFVDEFKKIPSPATVSTVTADSDSNRSKNRYRNIRAYDHSRVHLEINTSNNEGDYINASYLEGYNKEEKFIASQGPCASMLNDFIRMLWEQKVEKVVMLTNLIEEGKAKCLKYWPDDGKEKYGNIKVKLAATHVFADYTIRKLELIKKNQPTHSLTHFHFTSWPDKGVPATPWSLVDFEQRVAMEESTRPVVVHCSAGVGRTGTFIALRNVMREAEDTGVVNFFRTVSKLRQDRMMMIQTAEQYEFLHKAAQVAIVCMGTTVTSRDIESRISFLQEGQESGTTNMETEYNAVSTLCDYLCKAKNCEMNEYSELSVYRNKDSETELNRDPSVVLGDVYITKLSRESAHMRDYINAVVVPSFTQPDGQILTQLPMPTTVIDFWRLVMQHKVVLILAFETNTSEKDTTIGQYLPDSITEPLSCEVYEVYTDPVRNEDQCEIQNVRVKSKKKNYFQNMAHDHFLTHISVNNSSLNPKIWLNIVKKARAINTSKGRILYMCRDGVTYSGLACVLNLLLDRLDHDQSLTVPLVVGAVKCIRPQVIFTLEQYNCLYQVLQRYNETSSSYNNYDYPMVEKKFKPPRHIPQPIFDDVQYSNTS